MTLCVAVCSSGDVRFRSTPGVHPLGVDSAQIPVLTRGEREIPPPSLGVAPGVAEGRLSPGKGWGTLVVCFWHRRRLGIEPVLEALL